MLRGAFILAVGLSIGYVKGVSENVEYLSKLEDMAVRFNNYVETPPDENTRRGQRRRRNETPDKREEVVEGEIVT